jgi:ABC-type polysaccharide/polyol phosphate transport system ATPase subunit
VTAKYAVRAQDAGKRYVRFEDTPMLVTAAMKFRNRSRRSELWAVRHFDLELEPGTCVGVIGRNGSGKSTLLQMLAGVTAPTEGTVSVRGRVAPLISVGVGFHPELTGRENVFVNGSILGMSRRQIDGALDAIIDFSEIEEFIDTPVKFYSSGMAVRLGFSVAVHSLPEVLLVDEVLAVGDLAFQLKSYDRMMEIRASGSTIVVVSHNLNSVRNLADRCVVLHLGDKRFEGDTTDAIALYHDLMGEERELDDVLNDGPRPRGGESEGRKGARIHAVTLRDASGEPAANVHFGDRLTACVDIEYDRDVESSMLGLGMRNERNIVVYSDNNRKHGGMGRRRAGERVSVEVSFDVRLVTGSYTIAFTLATEDGVEQLALARPQGFFVNGRRLVHGVADLEAAFDVREGIDAAEVDAGATAVPTEG